jgi:two-component system, LytTR family, sensor kinase
MKNKIALQVVFWIALLGLNLALRYRFGGFEEGWLDEVINLVSYGLVFYFNILFLFPRFYDNKRGMYILLSIILIVIVSITVSLINGTVLHYFKIRHDDRHRNVDMFTQSIWLILVFLIGTVYSIQDRLNQQITHNKIITEEKLQTKLQLLKNQINPHFLFNALNNVYSLSYMKSEKAPESILKLSEMLRYVIEDCSQEFVTLNSEVAYILNYIEFYKMKSPGKRNISFSNEISNTNLHIAPMLFIPFIENSFKYSRIEEDKAGFVEIVLNEKDGELFFSCKNSIFAKRSILQGSGQGISNVRQRLEIIYPEKHSLIVQSDDQSYYTELKISLS